MEAIKLEGKEIAGEKYTEEALRAMDKQIEANMERIQAAMSANENKLLTSSMTFDKINELRLRQVDLGNTLSWLTQVRHNRCLTPLKEYEPKPRILRPGI